MHSHPISLVAEPDERSWLSSIIAEWKQTHTPLARVRLAQLPSYVQLRRAEATLRKQCIRRLVDEIHRDNQRSCWSGEALGVHQLRKTLLGNLFQSGLAFSETELLELAQAFGRPCRFYRHASQLPYAALLDHLETAARQNGLTPTLQRALQHLYFEQRTGFLCTDNEKINDRIDALLNRLTGAPRRFDPRDSVGKIIARFAESEHQPAAWQELLELLANASPGRPTRKWLRAAAELMPLLESDWLKAFVRSLCEETVALLVLVHKRDLPLSDFLRAENERVLRGAIWLGGLLQDSEINQQLHALCVLCFKRHSGAGPAAIRIGKACLFAFSLLPPDEGAVLFSNCRSKLKSPANRRRIERYSRLAGNRVAPQTPAFRLRSFQPEELL